MADAIAGSIAVIIPFYQKKTGILTKAIVSALNQTTVARVTIIVVDDASPVSAKSELAEIMAAHPGKIDIVEQPNAGPAAARNKGLDNVPDGTDYIAFLDSDDEWITTHLENAVAALGQGYDFYFSDIYQLNQSVGAFERAKRINIAEHPVLAGASFLHQYKGDLFDQVLRGNIIGTPTVVYRRTGFEKLRFREEFVYAGEDYLFWLEFATLTKKITFSSLCECRCGEGVNIFAGSGWGTENSLIRIHHEMKFKKAVGTLFPLNAIQTQAVQNAVRTLRKSFVADVLHRLSHKRPLDLKLLRNQLGIDPQTFLFFIPLAVSNVLRRQK